MLKKQTVKKGNAVKWTRFTRHNDAIFLSLHKEIRIGVLSVATLAFATPASAAGEMSYSDSEKSLNSQLSTLNAELEDETLDSILLSGTEVVATRVPIPASKAVRLVSVLTAKEIQASAAQSVNDLLKLVAGVDVRQRGGFGIQTDIGINGGNEDQLTVMLNGVNISNPHTGHLSVDLPVSVNDIERIEVLEGGASRVYGSSAFSGVINIVTKSEKQSNIGASAEGGSYGTWGLDGHVNLLSGKFSNRISGGWSQSDGAAANSDFKKGNAYWNEQYSSDLVDVKFQAGMSTMKYGANTFYGTGSTSQFEENSRYLISLQAETKGRVHVSPQVYWNRSYDHYVWTRSNPAAYQNYHLTNVYGANVNAWTQWALGKTAIGFEYRSENIMSTRLGKEIDPALLTKYPGYKYKDGRSNYGIYLEHDVILQDWSISIGVLANKNTSVVGGMKFYPGLDVSYSPTEGMRIYASFNQSLRTPTYTDLYYNGPGIEGNSQLKPEKSTDFALGWSYRTGMFAAQVKGFYRKGTDMIDWVKQEGASVWTTANSDIDNMGVSASADFDFTRKYGAATWLQKLSLSYCHIYQHRVNEIIKLNSDGGENWGSPNDQNFKFINDLMQLFVNTVRATGGNNEWRCLMVQPWACNPANAISDKFILPTDSKQDRIILEYHCYDPYNYATPKNQHEVSQKDYNDIANNFSKLNAKFVLKGIPCIMAEFGSTQDNKYSKGNDAADNIRAEYHTFVVKEAKKYNIPGFYWDNYCFETTGENFGLLDRKNCNFPARAKIALEGIMNGLK